MPTKSGGGWLRIERVEWMIAWRHLRNPNGPPRWSFWVLVVAVHLLLIGHGFAIYSATLAPDVPEAVMVVGEVADSTPLQRNFGTFGWITAALGWLVLVFAVLVRYFNLLASIITYSVMLGCMALVTVLSLMSGLEGDLRDKILAQKAHIRISGIDGNRFSDYEGIAAAVRALEPVAGASPYLEGEIMVRSGINRQGAVLIGVDPERLPTVSNIRDIVEEGSYDALIDPASIEDFDPSELSDGGVPWRLRHLEGERGKKAPPPPPPPPSNKTLQIDRPPTPTELDAVKGGGLVKPIEPDLAGLEPPEGTAPPLPELVPTRPGIVKQPLPIPGPGFKTPGLPGVADDLDDDGWEDPVEVLDLGEADPADPPADPPPDPPSGPSDPGTKFGAAPPIEDGGDGGGFGDGFEDPVDVLGLDPLPPPPVDPGPGPSEPPLGNAPPSDSEAVLDPILIGRELAMEVAVHTGARVQLITPVGRLTPAGHLPGQLAARVGGVFFSGMYEYDRKNVYAPLPTVQAFLRTGDRVTGIEVKLHDIEALDEGKLAIEQAIVEAGREDELKVETWQELNKNLFSAMFLEKIAMFVALSFVVLVASFGILASNLMSVLEKAKEIAILKAMGSFDAQILRVFMAEGLCVGGVGAFTGIGLGLAICGALDRFGLPINENVYYIERLPVVVNPLEVGIVGVSALLLVWAFSLYPGYVASRMRPVDGLRQTDA